MKLLAILLVCLLVWAFVAAGIVCVALAIQHTTPATVFASVACASAVFMLIEVLRRELW